MVLEISATPYIFTFKLWDWGRLGLNGQPRPIHIDHGEANIAWERNTEWVRRSLVNRVEPRSAGQGWKEERTGLHELEFIETRRCWFTDVAPHDTRGTVNVLNLVQGREATVESPTVEFEPFVVRIAFKHLYRKYANIGRLQTVGIHHLTLRLSSLIRHLGD